MREPVTQITRRVRLALLIVSSERRASSKLQKKWVYELREKGAADEGSRNAYELFLQEVETF